MSEKQFTTGARITCPSCKARTFVQDQPWKLVCLACYLERNPGKRRTPEPVPVVPAGIEPDMLRRLVQLCHPDRHGNSEAATTATRFLLALRSEARP